MIGVFDSGFGGLTVLSALVDRLPAYDQFMEVLSPDAAHKGGDHAKARI